LIVYKWIAVKYLVSVLGPHVVLEVTMNLLVDIVLLLQEAGKLMHSIIALHLVFLAFLEALRGVCDWNPSQSVLKILSWFDRLRLSAHILKFLVLYLLL